MAIADTLLRKVVLEQHDTEALPKVYMHRSIEEKISSLDSNREIIVLTGIRRCGKSVRELHSTKAVAA